MILAYSLFFLSILALLLLLTKALSRLEARPNRAPKAAFGFLTWLFATGWLGYSGLLADFSSKPPRFLWFILALTLATTALAFSPLGTRILKGTPVIWLVGYQSFRIPVEIMLHQLYLEGMVPVQMTYTGYNFDIVSGLSGLIIILIFRTRQPPNWLLWCWNLIALSLLITIVTIAVLSAPTPFQAFDAEPANTIVTGLPFIWLPAVLVTAALFGHLLVFRFLWSQKNHSKPATAL